MSNLLPRKDLQLRSHEYYGRVLCGVALITALTALAIFLLSLPTVILVQSASSQMGMPTSTTTSEVSAEVNRINSLVREVGDAVSDKKPSNTIRYVLSLRPPEVVIDDVTFIAGTPASLSLSGHTNRQDVLDVFRKKLIDEKKFESVSLPANALIGAEGGKFTLTLTGNF